LSNSTFDGPFGSLGGVLFAGVVCAETAPIAKQAAIKTSVAFPKSLIRPLLKIQKFQHQKSMRFAQQLGKIFPLIQQIRRAASLHQALQHPHIALLVA
jgi:hypothetical protein